MCGYVTNIAEKQDRTCVVMRSTLLKNNSMISTLTVAARHTHDLIEHWMGLLSQSQQGGGLGYCHNPNREGADEVGCIFSHEDVALQNMAMGFYACLTCSTAERGCT